MRSEAEIKAYIEKLKKEKPLSETADLIRLNVIQNLNWVLEK